MRKKVRLIFLPFIIIAICFVLLYTFLHWFFVIKTGTVDIKEDIVQLWLPLLLPWIPVLLWLRPRLRLLDMEAKKGKNRAFGYYILAAFAIAAPAIVAQHYMVVTTGKITSLNSINEINQHEQTKYYALKNHYVDKKHASVNYTSNVSGKYNSNLNLHIYVACPIYDTAEDFLKANTKSRSDSSKSLEAHKVLYILDGQEIDSAKLIAISPNDIASVSVVKGNEAIALFGKKASNGAVMITSKKSANTRPAQLKHEERPIPKAWLCLQFQKRISNRLSNEEKKEKENEFNAESEKNFDDSDLESFTYLELDGNNIKYDEFKKAVQKTGSVNSSAKLMLLEPKYSAFADRAGNSFAWIFISFAIGALIFYLLLLIPKFKNTDLQNVPVEEKDDSGIKEFFKLFIPRTGYYFTPIIININIVIFILMVCAGLGFISFSAKDLLDWGANYQPYTTDGQWWRLFTNIFLHGGLMHLLANMYGLLFVGIFLEPILGKNKYAISYLISGIVASIASIWQHTATVSIGASGAIFGLYGIFLTLLLAKVFPKDFNKAFLISILIFIGYNLLIGFTGGGTDNAAHIGGLVSGIVIGLFLYPQLKRQQEAEQDMQFIKTLGGYETTD